MIILKTTKQYYFKQNRTFWVANLIYLCCGLKNLKIVFYTTANKTNYEKWLDSQILKPENFKKYQIVFYLYVSWFKNKT